MCVRQKNGEVKQSVRFPSYGISASYAAAGQDLQLKRSCDVHVLKGATCVQKVFFQRSCYPDNFAGVGWKSTHNCKCRVLSSVINSDDFSPGSAFGPAGPPLHSRPAKAKPVSCWLKLASEVYSCCSQRCWFACGNDNLCTNVSYSGLIAKIFFRPLCSPSFKWHEPRDE